MKLLSVITSHKVATLVITSALVITGGGIAYATTQSKTDDTVVNSTTQPEVKETVKTEEPVATETPEVTIPVEPTPVEEPAEEVPAPAPYDPSATAINLTHQKLGSLMDNTKVEVDKFITLTFVAHPELFAEDKVEATVDKCVAYIKPILTNAVGRVRAPVVCAN